MSLVQDNVADANGDGTVNPTPPSIPTNQSTNVVDEVASVDNYSIDDDDSSVPNEEDDDISTMNGARMSSSNNTNSTGTSKATLKRKRPITKSRRPLEPGRHHKLTELVQNNILQYSRAKNTSGSDDSSNNGEFTDKIVEDPEFFLFLNAAGWAADTDTENSSSSDARGSGSTEPTSGKSANQSDPNSQSIGEYNLSEYHYRTLIRRFVNRSPAYRDSGIPRELRELVQNKITSYGKKRWGFQLELRKRHWRAKKQQRQNEKRRLSGSGKHLRPSSSQSSDSRNGSAGSDFHGVHIQQPYQVLQMQQQPQVFQVVGGQGQQVATFPQNTNGQPMMVLVPVNQQGTMNGQPIMNYSFLQGGNGNSPQYFTIINQNGNQQEAYAVQQQPTYQVQSQQTFQPQQVYQVQQQQVYQSQQQGYQQQVFQPQQQHQSNQQQPQPVSTNQPQQQQSNHQQPRQHQSNQQQPVSTSQLPSTNQQQQPQVHNTYPIQQKQVPNVAYVQVSAPQSYGHQQPQGVSVQPIQAVSSQMTSGSSSSGTGSSSDPQGGGNSSQGGIGTSAGSSTEPQKHHRNDSRATCDLQQGSNSDMSSSTISSQSNGGNSYRCQSVSSMNQGQPTGTVTPLQMKGSTVQVPTTLPQQNQSTQDSKHSWSQIPSNAFGNFSWKNENKQSDRAN